MLARASHLSFDTSVTGDNIEPVPLAPKGSEHSGNEDCWITGWGQIGEFLSLFN